MQIRTLLTTLVLSAGAMAAIAPDQELKSSDHKKMGKEVAAYWTAREETKDIAKTFQKLSETIVKTDEKLKKDGGTLLAAVEDWEAIFWNATEASLEDKKLKKGKVTEESNEVAKFTYWVERRYKSSNGPFPLVLVVPDAGESPEDVLTELGSTALGSGALLACAHMDGVGEDWAADEAVVQVLLTYSAVAKSNMFGLDCNKVFVLGRGKGFAAAVGAARQYPHFFAGVAGWGETPSATATNFSNLPTYVTGGGESAQFAKQIGELGYDNCTVGEMTADALWGWLESVERNSYPLEIDFVPGSATARSTYWLSVTGVDLEAEPSVNAKADPEKNEITITAKGVATIRLMLNDALANLGAPVKVVINGVPHEELVSRNARWMIDLAYDAGDWGRVFAATASFEVSETE